jgi:DDE family transposase
LASTCDLYAGLFADLAHTLHDPDFIAQHRVKAGDFTRQRRLTFPVLVAVLLGAFRGGLSGLLDEFFHALTGQWARHVSKSAFSQARKKLNASAFVALNERLLAWRAQHRPEPRWQGLRLVAADSTTLRLPPWAENQAAFGVQVDTAGRPYVLARALGLFASASGLMLRATLAPYTADERSLLLSLLPSLRADDLLVVDRGFPARWLFAHLHQQGIPLLARLDQTGWPAVETFLRSGHDQQRLTLAVSPAARRRAQALGLTLPATPVPLRLIRVLLPSGRVEVLATSLLEETAYPAAAFGALYRQRWAIEEAFKLLKQRLHIEQFSGELPESIQQDFQAKVLTANLVATLSGAAHDSLSLAQRQHSRPNLTYALGQVRLRLGLWLLKRLTPDQLLACLTLLARTREWYRPGRSAPRPPSPLKPKPRRAYK